MQTGDQGKSGAWRHEGYAYFDRSGIVWRYLVARIRGAGMRMIRLFKGDNKGGLADYDKAVQYDPADVFSRNNRGPAKLRLDDKAGAIADFRKALELRPDLATARANLQRLGVAP